MTSQKNPVIKKILLPIKHPAAATKLVAYAIDLAKRYDATLILLHVVDEDDLPATLSEALEADGVDTPTELANWEYRTHREVLSPFVNQAYSEGVRRVDASVDHGEPAILISDSSRKERVDIIVLGGRALGRIESFVRHSVANHVVYLAKCPVLIIK